MYTELDKYMTQDLLTIGEAARLLAVSTKTLRRWDKDGKLKAVVLNDRGDRRYKRDDIEKFIEELGKNDYTKKV